jgi:hypothetical protein
MPGKAKRRGPEGPAKTGPVKPGTPLYRVLQRIADEIAKSLDSDSQAKPKQERKG